MTILYYPTKDMFELSNIADYMVNPTNILGSMDMGIGLEFSNKFSKLKKDYKKDIAENRLYIGSIQVLKYKEASYSIINMPTKNHYADGSDLKTLESALSALRKFFKDKGQYHVVLPLLGQDRFTKYSEGCELFKKYLGDLKTIFHVCIQPGKFSREPKYLGIFGPNINDIEVDKFIELTQSTRKNIDEYLTKWDIDIQEFDKIVTFPEKEIFGSIIQQSYNLDVDKENVLELEMSPSKSISPPIQRGLQLIMSMTHLILLDDASIMSNTVFKTLENTTHNPKLIWGSTIPEDVYKEYGKKARVILK